MLHFQTKAEIASTRVRHRAPELVAMALREAIDAASKTNLFVAGLPTLNDAPHIASAESLSQKSVAGKRDEAIKLGLAFSSAPVAVAAQLFKKDFNAAPSRILWEIQRPIAIPPHSKTFTWILVTRVPAIGPTEQTSQGRNLHIK